MRRIAMSLGAIAFVAAVAIGATGAFFSDTETSSGNTFSAGSIDLTVGSTSHYAGLICTTNGETYTWQPETATTTVSRPDLIGQPCSGTWTQGDLGPTNQFFNFSDIKPGDPGEDTLSLTAGNDAWMCADIKTTSNAENVATEPELSSGDTAANGNFDGELAQNIQFYAWLDTASTSGAVPGDNIHQAGEPALFGPVSAFSLIGATTTLPLADSVTNGGIPFAANTQHYVGIAWCAGTISIATSTGAVSCDGSTMGNNTQTDSMTADISLRAEQARNNSTFVCGSGTTTSPTDIYAESFEGTGDVDWQIDSIGALNLHVPGGSEGIPASVGSFFATTTGDAFTHWGSYSNTFPAGGYTTQVDVYLDTSKVTNDPSDTGYFDFSSAINDPSGTHRRDFIFHVGHNPTTGGWAATVSNNSSDDSTLPQGDDPQITGSDPFQISTTGWYTLQSYFHDNGSGVLTVTMNLLNHSGTVLHTWTLSDPSDVIGTTVGGHRYGWFSAEPFELPFDNARYYLGAPN